MALDPTRSFDEVKHAAPSYAPHVPPASNRIYTTALRIIAALALVAGIGVAIAGFTVVWYAVAAVAGLWLLAELINQVGSSKVSSQRPPLLESALITNEEIEGARSKVQEVLNMGGSVEGITRLAPELIFFVDAVSGLIFKTKAAFNPHQDSLEDVQAARLEVEGRFNKMRHVQKIVQKNHYHRIIVPDVRRLYFTVNGALGPISVPVVVERRLDVETILSVNAVAPKSQREAGQVLEDPQEKVRKYAKDDLELTRQEARVIAKGGLGDCEPRNYPIGNFWNGAEVVRAVAVIDTDQPGTIETAFIGDPSRGSRGLIGCLFSEAQIDVAIDVAVDETPWYSKRRIRRVLETKKAERLGELRRLPPDDPLPYSPYARSQ